MTQRRDVLLVVCTVMLLIGFGTFGVMEWPFYPWGLIGFVGTAGYWIINIIERSRLWQAYGLALIGMSLNTTAVVSNHGFMPYLAAKNYGYGGVHRPAYPRDHLLLLCDRIDCVAGIISVGDLFLFSALGVFVIGWIVRRRVR